MEEVKAKKCPFCLLGQVYSPHRRRFVTCGDCAGRGFVPAQFICACGRPVVIVSADKFPYCGEKTCLTLLRADAKEDAEEEKSPTFTGFSTRGPFPGYGASYDL